MTRNELKYYSSLLKKKFRTAEKKFIAEGTRLVEVGLNSKFYCEKIFVTHEYHLNHKSKNNFRNNDYEILNKQDFLTLTDTVNPQGIAAVFRIPQGKNIEEIKSQLVVYLDNISDPGNLGTIIRTCDWFGVSTLLLSSNTVNVYDSKVVRSTMGSLFHIDIFENVQTESLKILKKKGFKILSSHIKGEDIYKFKFPDKMIITFSSETAGPSEDILNLSDYIITIPKKGKAESLNVASAAAVILSKLSK